MLTREQIVAKIHNKECLCSVNGEKTVLRPASFGIKMQIRERKTAKISQNLLFMSVIFS